MSTFKNVVYKLIKYITAAYVGLVILLDVFRDKNVDYIYKNQSVIPNVAVFGAFLLVLFVAFLVSKKKSGAFKEKEADSFGKKSFICIGLLSLFLFAIQLIISWNIYLETGWDCGTLTDMAKYIALEGGKLGSDLYFSQHSNNVFLLAIQVGILRFVKAIGITGSAASYFPMVVVSCLFVNLSGYFVWDLTRIITSEKLRTWLAWGMFVILVGLNPWMCIPYSDSYSIVFPILILWFYERFMVKEEQVGIYGVKWIVLTFLTMVGYYIKPTVIIIFLCIFVIEVIEVLSDSIKNGKHKMFIIISCLSGLVLGFTIADGVNAGLKDAIGSQLDSNQDYGPAHFFYLGTNYDICGTYDQADVNFSGSFQDKESRNSADLQAGLDRIKNMGFRKFLVHIERKLLVNFNDGTFSWENEGDFYKGMQDRDSQLSKLIRNYYYNPEKIEYHSDIMNYVWFHTISQTLWMILLFLFFTGTVVKEQIKSPAIFIARLAILGIFIFVMIFEARARYLYLYAPVFIAVTSMGYIPFLKERKSLKA